MIQTARLLQAAIAACLCLVGPLAPAPAKAQAEPFLGQIMMVGYTFCPRGWAEANGQLLPISNNTALYSLYGTTYGGDGRTSFALPDLRGRVAIHTGTGPGLSPRQLGARAGTESNTLNVNQMPPHSHSLNGTTTAAASGSPAGNLAADTGRSAAYAAGSADAQMSSSAIGTTGAGQPVDNMPPYLVMRYCVALQGIYPSRS